MPDNVFSTPTTIEERLSAVELAIGAIAARVDWSTASVDPVAQARVDRHWARFSEPDDMSGLRVRNWAHQLLGTSR